MQVAWRDIGKGPPPDDAPDLHRDELCSVPFYELAKLTKNHSVWRFDSLRRKWTEVDRLFPGLAVVVDVTVGGYQTESGFTGDKSDVPADLQSGGSVPDYDEADGLAYGAATYVTMQMHADDTAEAMEGLLAEVAGIVNPFVENAILVDAARWHDTGKVHPAFQTMLTANLPIQDPRRNGGPWAKSDGKHPARNPRRFFRHELASALAWLAEGRSDLGGFIVAAHHGKVRLSLRARPGEEPPTTGAGKRFAHGVHDGDVLPAVDLGGGLMVPEQTLSLACMELGGSSPSWADRMIRLLEEHGPFRLAFVEMLVRVADWRATRKRAPGKETRVPEGQHG